ncbi:M12 family metallopeptidase [Apibacter raozihei]|uniref:M12 family metallopeptidase n=1 Tax=Apibacter raozihei TaxID=2500547 RepID=UPI000FE39613|nr:M12 family metallopeptidase [Apibacter raozihei]
MKNYFNLFFIACVLFLSSCSDESINPVSSTDIQSNAKEHLCLDAIVPEDLLENPKLTTHGALLKSKKWENGQTITIKFLNGNAFLQNKVKQFANQWMQYANLKFVYVNANQSADIRINFDNSGGSWSYLGTDSKRIDQSKPSMNFGWFNNSTPDTEFSRTVIHEFGHALGLIHEHQNPAANIQWNKAKVYSYYGGAPNYWTTAQVDNNIINKYSSTVTNYSSFDSQSIMLYSFPASLTLNGWSSGWNTALSATDKNFISQEYPKPKPSAELRNLYRYNINAQHFYTSNFAELGNRYYEGVLGKVYSQQVSNTLPIYRYFNSINGDRLSTLNWNELKGGGQGGWRYEGITGYAYQSAQPNTIPVYRYYKGGNKPDHFYTINSSEVAGGKYGYQAEGIAFYVVR